MKDAPTMVLKGLTVVLTISQFLVAERCDQRLLYLRQTGLSQQAGDPAQAPRATRHDGMLSLDREWKSIPDSPGTREELNPD